MNRIYIKVSDSRLPECIRVSIFSHMQTSPTPERELAKIQRAAARKGLSAVTYSLSSHQEQLHLRLDREHAARTMAQATFAVGPL